MTEIIEWIEIDQDSCSRDFGVSPCTATGEKCFNTVKTCKDIKNYNKSFITLRFCENRSIIPNDNYYIPTLQKVTIHGGRLNPIGVGAGSGALGIRSQLSVVIKDHPDDDKLVDKYRFERNYIAKEQGTFWTKWRARNQYYLGRPIRHCVGDIDADGNVTNVITRHFFITDFNGVTGSGQVSFEGKDLLSQFTDEKAVLPRASTGVLLADITDTANSFTITPSGIGNLDYPTSGFIRVKKEVMQFTRSGDVFTVVRGQYGTTADKAAANDTVQLCVQFYQQTPAEILQIILQDYVKIPLQYLDITGWNAEKINYLNRVYTTLITEPTGITTLINEMCEQMFFYLLWDDRDALLRMRAVRPAQGDTIYELDEDFILADSTDVNDLTEQLVTETNIYYGLINAAEKANEPKNYAGVQTIKNITEESSDRLNSTRVKQVFCRFIPRTNSGAAIELGNRYLQRYGTTPRQINLAVKQLNNIKLGDFAKVTTRLNVDSFGNKTPLNIQILETAETKTGVILTLKGQEFYSEVPVDKTKKTIPIDINQVNVTLRNIYNQNHSDVPVSGDEITFIVRSGTVIGGHCFVDAQGTPKDPTYKSSYLIYSTSKVVDVTAYPLLRRGETERIVPKRQDFFPGLFSDCDIKIMPTISALKTGEWPTGVKLKLIVESGAYIIGQGGFPSFYVLHPTNSESNSLYPISSDGGDAIEVTHPISIINNGVIGGGGGGGAPSVATVLFGRIQRGTTKRSVDAQKYLIATGGAGAGYWTTNSFLPINSNLNENYNYLSFLSLFDGGKNSITNGGSGARVDYSVDYYSNYIDALSQTNQVVRAKYTGSAIGANGGSLGLLGEALRPSEQKQIDTVFFGNRDRLFSYSSQITGDFIINIFHLNGLAGRAVATGSNLITWLNKGQVYGDEL